MILPPQLVLLSWPLIILALFKRFPIKKAIIVSFIVAWLFLPERLGFALIGLPDYNRMSATCYSIFICTIIFDFRKFQNYKFSWIDLPILLFCISSFFSSIFNDLGLYDGIAATLSKIVRYGFPYLIGRIHLNRLSDIKKLAIAIFISGVIYAPLCLFEARMSPQLHRIVYGYHGAPFGQQIRYGGFRPTVFMRHGLSVGMWMMSATLIGLWLWQSGVLKRLWNIPMSWLISGLSVTLVLIKSTGAYIYFIYGIAILFTAKKLKTGILLIFLIISLSCYLLAGATGNFSGGMSDQILESLYATFPRDRIGSLQYRLDNEEILSEKARQRPIFGWGGWGRNRVFEYNSAGELVDISTTDSLWIITYGQNGILGLVGIFATSLLPCLYFAWSKFPARFWFHHKVAPAAALAVVVSLYMLDCTLNNQYNPVFMLVSGSLAGLIVQPLTSKKKRKNLLSSTKKLRSSVSSYLS